MNQRREIRNFTGGGIESLIRKAKYMRMTSEMIIFVLA